MKNIIFILLCFLAVSCARDINNDSYQLSSVGTAGQIGEGVVIDVRDVRIQGQNAKGAVLGVAAGGVVGSTIGRGSARILASVGGALAGMLIGGIVQKELSEQKALQYIVRLNNGKMISVIQGMKNRFSVGQRVLVLYGKETHLIAAPDNY